MASRGLQKMCGYLGTRLTKKRSKQAEEECSELVAEGRLALKLHDPTVQRVQSVLRGSGGRDSNPEAAPFEKVALSFELPPVPPAAEARAATLASD